MAKFKYKSIKKMQPRNGNTYSTDFYQQAPEEYERATDHICDVAEQAINIAKSLNRMSELETPLPGYRRTQQQPNYSQMDIIEDMVTQVCKKKHDIPSGMLGRWNKIFADNPECQIEMEEETTKPKIKNNFGELFK